MPMASTIIAAIILPVVGVVDVAYLMISCRDVGGSCCVLDGMVINMYLAMATRRRYRDGPRSPFWTMSYCATCYYLLWAFLSFSMSCANSKISRHCRHSA